MYDVVIIGGGPAGQSAALFTSKAGKATLIIDDAKGLTQKAWVRNHYGVDDVAGGDLVKVGHQQAAKFGTEFVKAKVKNIIQSGEGFTIETEEGENYQAQQVILATGANQKLAQDIGLETKDGQEPYVKTVIVVDAEGRTSLKGIWAAGTAGGVSVHTIVTSGDGARVAINLLSELEGKRYVDHDVLDKKK
ncbi:thioredoxin reductase [Pullulanibacillus camelliae]|uniref:Thioredoxin reductase n=1 Tax=Pullulanibacillus camelliae TaxID=1707096 RepID=A0A8J2YF11_9BACL|nr:FAD-dependent oxidoreductase [Pullulanibacillus camelliae]GGE39801.1 thioredoxin reductase [Pullulanibacillus camelliae]